MQVCEKVGKSQFTVFFPMVSGSGGSKSNLAKAAGAAPAGQIRDKTVRAVVAQKHISKSKVSKTHRCGAKHISKSKCTKHEGFETLFDVPMSKKCATLWHEAHFQVKSVKQ